MEDLRYPIGRFDPNGAIPAGARSSLMDGLAAVPGELRRAVSGLSDAQLDTAYRHGGWTVRQVVHHVADSHINAYVRMRWALTEDAPLIKTYQEKAWAELPDAVAAPVEPSLDLVEALHVRWLLLLRDLRENDWTRTIQHPDWGAMQLGTLLAMYEWHGRHHAAHISGLRQRLNWP